jgi:hypothetical protein
VTEAGGWFELFARRRRDQAPQWLHRGQLPADFYGDLEAAAKMLTLEIRQATTAYHTKQHAPLTLSLKSGRGVFTFSGAAGISIRLGVDLARLWGFLPATMYSVPTGHSDKKDSMIHSPYTASIHGNRGSLFITCSGIEDTMLGNEYVKLIQVASWVPATSKDSPTRHLEFQHPVYHRLVDRGADSLKIEIKDSIGLPVEFFAGNSIATLLVRDVADE